MPEVETNKKIEYDPKALQDLVSWNIPNYCSG